MLRMSFLKEMSFKICAPAIISLDVCPLYLHKMKPEFHSLVIILKTSCSADGEKKPLVTSSSLEIYL